MPFQTADQTEDQTEESVESRAFPPKKRTFRLQMARLHDAMPRAR